MVKITDGYLLESKTAKTHLWLTELVAYDHFVSWPWVRLFASSNKTNTKEKIYAYFINKCTGRFLFKYTT